MFWSRALMSLTQGAWCMFAIAIGWKQLSWKNPLFIWSLAPMALWLLGAYQGPMSQANGDLALTWAMYPATVLVVQTTSAEIRQNHWIKIWLAAAFVGAAYPIGYFLTHAFSAVQDYGQGKSLPTFMDTDHVRFSIFLCASFLLLLTQPILQKKIRFFLAAVLAIIIVFLSVRTGWAILILTLFLYPLLEWKQLQAITKNKAGYLIFIVLTLMTSAYFLFPTVQQKIAYSIWEWKQFQPGQYNPTYSDGTRRAINWAAWQAIQEGHSNAGWAGIPATLSQSFTQLFNGQSTEFGWPFNQWLFWWMGAGWWTMILFSGWLLYPIWQGIKLKEPGLVIWTIAIAISCLIETTLNYQFGAFLHLFPLALYWQQAMEHRASE
ncbi:MAG: hypothetical protein CFE25_03515 [Chitinophagaceae bacterium BSSC1]|nr:MAG: hypothetical protein CFE25_03515 [Chitinophagaceae bacterium BSSC1]